MTTPRSRTPHWSRRRLKAAINAVAAMLAGEEGEGDWDPDNTADDLQGALRCLQYLYKKTKK